MGSKPCHRCHGILPDHARLLVDPHADHVFGTDLDSRCLPAPRPRSACLNPLSHRHRGTGQLAAYRRRQEAWLASCAAAHPQHRPTELAAPGTIAVLIVASNTSICRRSAAVGRESGASLVFYPDTPRSDSASRVTVRQARLSLSYHSNSMWDRSIGDLGSFSFIDSRV